MSRVFTSRSTGARIYVFSDDHCPPHIHARHRGDGWIARVRFSFVASTVTLLSIAPLQNVPLQRTVNELLDDIADGLSVCRRSWWATRQTTCLANQWAVISAGAIELALPAAAKAKQIAAATYDPAQELLRVTFHDGTTSDASIRP